MKLTSLVRSMGREGWYPKEVFVLAILLAVAVASANSTARVSSHGGDTTLVHACVNNTNAEVRILEPGPGDANTLCPDFLGADWINVHLDSDWTGTGTASISLVDPTDRVGIGTATPTEQLELTENLRLPPTTATTGIIKSGSNTMIHTFGSGNFFAGENAGNLTMTGVSNTATGEAVLINNTTGSNNTATGRSALISNTTGSSNTAMGLDALINNTTGNNNTAMGHGALFANNTGSANTATGLAVLFFNTTGFANTATGSSALRSNTTGSGNTAAGRSALINNTTGSANTATGRSALRSNTTGNNNTAVGEAANVSMGNLFNATAIGAGAIVNASNKIRLGNAGVTVIEGQVGFTSSSDAHQKENFLPVDGEETLHKLRHLTVGSWNLKGQDPTRFRHYGPTAQEFFAAFGQDDLGTIGSETTITTTDIDGIMLLAVQALERRTLELQEDLTRVREELVQLEAEKEAGAEEELP
jgi:hypothetical protein